MLEFDPGPPRKFLNLFARVPSYEPFKELFWYDWGPVFYRGRLDGSARVLVIASDPGPTERLVGRTLVGDAGQRVQGVLTKLGLDRSYLCLNAHAYALHPGKGSQGLKVLNDPAIKSWRNELYNAAKGKKLQAVIAFGDQAQQAVALWDGKGNLPVWNVPHPSSRDPKKLLDAWRAAVSELRGIVTPDAAGDPNTATYGDEFLGTDYARIPSHDLPFGVPAWIGDDTWGRTGKPKHFNCVSRPSPDDEHTLIWIAPRS
jgi:Uracil DNA glycosylase superfamily